MGVKNSFEIKKSPRYDLFDSKTGLPVFWGDEISIAYTFKDDDIKGTRLNLTTPYEDRRGNLTFKQETDDGYILHNPCLLTELAVTFRDDVIYFDLKTDLDFFSEFGLNLPFNFIGKKNGGSFDEQYLFNSPYRSVDNKHKYCYLKSIKGRDLFVAFLSDADGWKMDYSPWVGGHYFNNLKCLANFDHEYHTGSDHRELKLAIFFCDSFESGLKKLSEVLELPILYYEKNYSFDGSGRLKIIGKCDRIEQIKDGKILKTQAINESEFSYTQIEGKNYFIPYICGKQGLDCSVFGYRSLKELAKLYNDSAVRRKNLIHSENLCEYQFWASAMLKYMLKYGEVKEYTELLNEFFEKLMPTDVNKGYERLSIFKESLCGLPEYSVYKSRRIQEHFCGVSILLDAYSLYKEQRFLDYAVGVLNSLIDNYQHQNGGFFTSYCDESEDYSTVTCLLIPIVDAVLFFRDRDEALYKKYKNSAKKLTEYIYERGLSFPTEGGASSLAEEQMEDGSISCSALSLLYYSAKIERHEQYILKAKEILDLHDAWVMKTPDANVYNSTLRWWETRWEGDEDGPALCCGHGWTIWRAEADFWYYRLTGNADYLKKALNGFTTNFAKHDGNGNAYSIYQVDYIAGGGFRFKKNEVKYRVLNSHPDRFDVDVSRYSWARAYDTVFTLNKDELTK